MKTEKENPLIIKFRKLNSAAVVPQKQTDGAAAYDVYAAESKVIKKGERAAVATGLTVEIPVGYYLSVRPRSGLAIKKGVTCINTPGTIDSDYRGEIFILLVNLGTEDFDIQAGDRIAQILPEKEIPALWVEVSKEDISQTERGEGGFGSTGSN